MPQQIIITKAFRFAHGGIRVVEYFEGKEPVEVDDDVAELALTEKWARRPRAAAPRPPAGTPADAEVSSTPPDTVDVTDPSAPDESPPSDPA